MNNKTIGKMRRRKHRSVGNPMPKGQDMVAPLLILIVLLLLVGAAGFVQGLLWEVLVVGLGLWLAGILVRVPPRYDW